MAFPKEYFGGHYTETKEKKLLAKVAKKQKGQAAPIELKLAKPKELKDKLPKKFLQAKYIIAEPKLDGFRGIAIVSAGKCKLYTSGGVEVVNGPKIVSALLSVHTPSYGSAVYDGEFFTKNWNDTGSIVKTLTPNHPERKKLRFRVFDILTMEEWSTRKGIRQLYERKIKLKEVQRILTLRKEDGVEIMPYTKLYPVEAKNAAAKMRIKIILSMLQDFFKQCVKEKHEGAVFKNPNSVYSFKKSDDWLKMKPVHDSDLKIVGVHEGTRRNKGRLGAFICEGKIDGKKVKTKVGGGLTDALRTKFWKMHEAGTLVGKIIEIRHEGLTSNNAVRFPRFFRERWDKRKPN